MTDFFLLPFAAGFASLVLAILSVRGRKRSPAAWSFFAGMVLLGVDSVFTGLSLHAIPLRDVDAWLSSAFVVKCLLPAVWLWFSLTYSRSNYTEFIVRWRVPLAVVGLLPVALALGFHEQLFEVVSPGTSDDPWRLQFGAVATALNVFLLIGLVLILINLEQTFRATVGTMRWRIKFVVLALAVIFGARLYVRSQAILFSAPDIALWSVESGSLLIGCVFLAIAYLRTGLAEIDVYPSFAVLRSSLTILIVGAYLLIVGVIAQFVTRFGGAEIFQFQAVVLLVGMSGLAILLLSDRARQRIHVFTVRHFRGAQHDSVRIWTLFSQRLASVNDQADLCDAAAKLISETFDVLSVTVWLLDEEKDCLMIRASTALRPNERVESSPPGCSSRVVEGLHAKSSPFDLEVVNEAWADEFRQHNPTSFARGGNRLCITLCAAEHTVGVVVLADRVSGAVYTFEELELLKCIGDHMTSVLLNLRLASEVARARELEAFRTMSAFFVHDLKNAAASLNLMLKNLPVHFDNPEFREDALRGVGNTARRIDDMIARLSAFRNRPELARLDADLNQLVAEALDRVNGWPNVELMRELQPVPTIVADGAQIQSVVTNLVLNARDAVGSGGRIRVRTEQRGGRALLSIEDSGCGMTESFIKGSLFRPFQSTKKNGLGIGLFQCQAIVQAHGGRMHVESQVGQGTTFVVSLPIKDAP